MDNYLNLSDFKIFVVCSGAGGMSLGFADSELTPTEVLEYSEGC